MTKSSATRYALAAFVFTLASLHAQDPKKPAGPPFEPPPPPPPPPAMILVSVTSHGKPAANATVTTHLPTPQNGSNGNGFNLVTTCKTDASGNCGLTLMRGKYTFTAKLKSKHVSHTQEIDDSHSGVSLELYPATPPHTP